jgi:hypothetical protein
VGCACLGSEKVGSSSSVKSPLCAEEYADAIQPGREKITLRFQLAFLWALVTIFVREPISIWNESASPQPS